LPEECVTNYLTTYLNVPVPGPPPPSFSVLDLPQQYGLLVVCDQSEIRSKRPPGRLTHHTKTYLAIPVCRSDVNEGGKPTESIVWVQPFVFGDNSYVMFGSREIWGMDMTHATLRRDRAEFPALHIDWSVMGMKAFSPQSEAALIPCLHLAAEIGVAPHDPRSNPEFHAFCDKLGANGYPSPPAPLRQESAPPSAPSPAPSRKVELNNLKQFRDVYDMNAAIYRAIVQSISTHRNIEFAANALEKAEINFFWSDSVKEMLKLLFGKAESDGSSSKEYPDWLSVPVTVDLAYAFTSDVHFAVVKTLHSCRSPDEAPRQNLGAVLQT
jgi:hypothetical protein